MGDVGIRPQPLQDWDSGDPEVIRLRPGETPLEAKRRLGMPVRPKPQWVPVYAVVSNPKCDLPECWAAATEERILAEPGEAPETIRLCRRHAHQWDLEETAGLVAEPADAEAQEAARRAAADQGKRREMGVAAYPRNRPDKPSKTPQGRQEEYRKAREARARARLGQEPPQADASK